MPWKEYIGEGAMLVVMRQRGDVLAAWIMGG